MKAIDQSNSRFILEAADSVRELLRFADVNTLKVLQFDKPLPIKLLEALNAEFFPRWPEIHLRAYGFYGQICDLSICSKLTNVEHFLADSLHDVVGVEHIQNMRRLKTLNIGIWNLESITFLSDVNPALTELCVSATKSKKPDLAVLNRFHDLKKLFLNGQQKNIDVIGTLQSLQILALSSITIPSLSLVRRLPNIWSLTLLLGGTRDISALEGLEGLKNLELSWIREFVDLNVVGSLAGLQHLSIDRLSHIESLPDLSQLHNLRRVTLDLMKGLVDISSLVTAPNLEEVVHIDARVLPEAYIPLLRKPSLQAAQAGFGSTEKNVRFKQLCSEHNVRTGYLDPFSFH